MARIDWTKFHSPAFHIHTYRCNHAENIPDETYIRKAFSLHADSIWFTDHAPFEGDMFRNRMLYRELDEYLDSMTALKAKYANTIPVFAGLEIEYLDSFDENGYYKRLVSDERIDLLLLGQHMCEIAPGKYTFDLPQKEKKNEYKYLAKSMVSGIETGYFNVIAHPDRIFKRSPKRWDDKMSQAAENILLAAAKTNIPIEKNMESAEKKVYYPEFWEIQEKMAPDIPIVTGMDAHSIQDLEARWEIAKKFEKDEI